MTKRNGLMVGVALVLIVGVVGFVPWSTPELANAASIQERPGQEWAPDHFNPYHPRIHLRDRSGVLFRVTLRSGPVEGIFTAPIEDDAARENMHSRLEDLVTRGWAAEKIQVDNLLDYLRDAKSPTFAGDTLGIVTEIVSVRETVGFMNWDPPDTCIKLRNCMIVCGTPFRMFFGRGRGWDQ